MKTRNKSRIACLLMLSAASPVSGGQQDAEIVPQPPPASGWEFRIEPYAWLTGLNGTTGVGPLTADVDASFFGDIVDSLKMAAALQFEARNGRWGVIADGFYADLGSMGSTPGPLYGDVQADLKQFIGELDVAYRVYESPNGFVDVYAGMRYNNLSLDLDATLDVSGIQAVSENMGESIVTGIGERAGDAVASNLEDFKAANATKRAEIEDQIKSAIKAEGEDRLKQELVQRLKRIRRDGEFDLRDVAISRIARDLKSQRLELARSNAELAVARIRAAADAKLQGKVTQAESRVQQAEKELSNAISNQLQNRLPTSSSADKEWLDPIIGIRAQWNFNEEWYLAGKSDIGGFGVGSDLAWTMQGTVGYNFTEKVSAELGYRYLDTDYSDGDFSYDIAEHGLFLGVNMRF